MLLLKDIESLIPSRMIAVITISLLGALESSAFANSTNIADDLRVCATMAAPQSRLECVDTIIVKNNLKSNEAPVVDDVGQWRVDEDISPIDDSKIRTAMLSAHQVSGGGFIGTPTATIVARCKERKLDFYVATSEFLGTTSSKAVVVRIGQQQAKTSRWEPAASGKGVGLWGTAQSSGLVKDLIQAGNGTLVLRIDTYSSQITAQYDIAGVKAALSPIVELCAPRAPQPKR